MSEIQEPSEPGITVEPATDRRLEVSQLLKERMRERGVDMPETCAMCHKPGTWQFGRFVPVPISHSPTAAVVGTKKIYPTVSVFCTNCGYTVLFNLINLGFTSEDWASLTLPEDV